MGIYSRLQKVVRFRKIKVQQGEETINSIHS